MTHTPNQPRNFLGSMQPVRAVSGPQAAKNVVGPAMERLVAKLLGGEVWDWRQPPMPVPAHVCTEIGGAPYALQPDVWWPAQTALVEVKAGIGRYFVTERQWRAYTWAKHARQTALPVLRPRIYYAFVGYSLPHVARRYKDSHALLDDVLSRMRHILVLDSALLARLLESANKREDQEGPLSPMLGAWSAHWSVTRHRMQTWAEKPRESLDALGLSSWRVTSLAASQDQLRAQLAAQDWTLPTVPAYILHPRRVERISGPLSGAQPTFDGADWF